MNTMHFTHQDTPVGSILLLQFGEKLYLSEFSEFVSTDRIRKFRKSFNALSVHGNTPLIDEAIRQIEEYFSGSRKRFSLPLELTGTDFQKAVWREVSRIPYGETVSYRSIAENIGKPKAVRAVANAVGANPFPIIIPCHRVIPSDGSEGVIPVPPVPSISFLNLRREPDNNKTEALLSQEGDPSRTTLLDNNLLTQC